MRWRAVDLLILGVLACSVQAQADEAWRDDFTAPLTYEVWGARCWALGKGEARFRVEAGDSRLVAATLDLSDATIRARLTLDERLAGSYVYAGITLFAGPENHWQLLLVESPEGRRYLELVERLDGIHQAQAGAGTTRTALAGEDAGELREWEYGKPYELEVSVSGPSITGRVTDPAAGASWQRTYDMTGKDAVRRGRPGVTASGLSGAFGSLVAEGSQAPEGAVLDIAQGPAGAAAIIADREGRLGTRWAEVLREAGFGATVASWEDLVTEGIPPAETDLILLADARSASVQARDTVRRALRAGGKVIAVGAPAFSEVLANGPQTWTDAEGVKAAAMERLQPVPIRIDPGAWRRAARYPERESSIEPCPEEGPDCWKLFLDLDGWDGFAAPIEGAFGEDRSLLVFWARGDEETSQLAVEAREKDGSRWIVAVELTPEWRPIVLRPHDFPYWHDSPAQRGFAGDHFRPQNVASITIGLAGSHTTKVADGPHTFWVRDLGTAEGLGDEALDFSIPEVEALSPSYKLFPLKAPVVLRAGGEQGILPAAASVRWEGAGYSPVWRERGRGFDRQRSFRWVPILEARDDEGWHRGALVSLMVGDAVFPNAMWANVAVADPEAALTQTSLRRAVVATARAMVRGCFLLEGGAAVFSCEPGETLTFGAEVLNAGRQTQNLAVSLSGPVIGGMGGALVAQQREEIEVGPGRRATVSWPIKAPVPGRHKIETRLVLDGQWVDTITHDLVVEERQPAQADDFVRVEGDRFMLGDEPWYFKGVNYRPSWVGGYPHLNLMARECYDPEIVERDLTWMQSIGINALSAVHALMPPDPEAPEAFRDQVDFLDRCERHGIKVFFFLPHARPFADADPEWVKQYLVQAGIRDHPAVMTWELAWEPIHGAWDATSLAFMIEPWNDWVVQRYGSIENAVADWGYRPELGPDGKLPVPNLQMTTKHGDWDGVVAAFRRAWSDTLSKGYQRMAEPLRAFDPRHLVSFRFGACGIPHSHRFAHAHSAGVAKHVDFMNPEGYDLKRAFGVPTPPDDIRKGGLVTQYYRFLSREKPVVWMEFGYTVTEFAGDWQPDWVHIKPEELARQKAEYEDFYGMFIESGARGAAPWWFPGGFRLGERSDFGLVDPDGAERPVCEVLREYLPRFAEVEHLPPTAEITLDLDAHYADSWETYATEYLGLVQAGKRPCVRTAGTGTDSATCPLTAVGGTPYNGHNPPAFLNAEFNTLEVRSSDGEWSPVAPRAEVDVVAGRPVTCRASVGNIGEATWLAPRGNAPGGVLLAGRAEYGLDFAAPIAADTPYLADARVPEFVLIPKAEKEITISFEMLARDRAYFGERVTATFRAVER